MLACYLAGPVLDRTGEPVAARRTPSALVASIGGDNVFSIYTICSVAYSMFPSRYKAPSPCRTGARLLGAGCHGPPALVTAPPRRLRQVPRRGACTGRRA